MARHTSSRPPAPVRTASCASTSTPSGTAKHEHRYLSHEQVDDLATATGYPSDPSRFSSLNTRENETYRLVVLFLAYTGVRFGEMAALRVARLDLRRNRAVIVEW
jgi:integrase